MTYEEISIKVSKDECWLLFNLVRVRINQLEEDKHNGETGLDELISDYYNLLSRIPRYAERNCCDILEYVIDV